MSPKRIVDTNVAINANRATMLANTPPGELPCVLACVEALTRIVANCELALDAGDEIFKEYRTHLHLSGQPGIGDAFVKWVSDNQGSFDRVSITKNGDSYNEFPDHEGLIQFDSSDRKFVAVANAHPEKPPILQATDSKWWGWKEALAEAGITVDFVCRDYIEAKFKKKMES